MMQKGGLEFGDVVWVEFDPSIGHEFRNKRPAIVIQSNEQLKKSNLVTIIPLTSNTGNTILDDIVVVSDSDNNLGTDSVAKVYCITSFDYSRFDKKIDAWIKSRDTGFYTISYSWRKGEHPKIGEFNPDFFIKIGNNILIIETKSETDISDENKGKVEYTKRHIEMLNKLQKKQRYYFWMISPQDYNSFFHLLRDGKWADFSSTLEINLKQSN